MGGEEFFIVFEDVDEDGVCLVVECIRRCVSVLSFPSQNGYFRITVLIGFLIAFCDGEKVDKLIECADQVLYCVKLFGWNCVFFC